MAIQIHSDTDGGALQLNGVDVVSVNSTGEVSAKINGTVRPLSEVTPNVVGSAPVFACRAWVNFDGTRNVTNTGASTNGQPVFIRASGNVTSVIKNGTGDYTINFTTAMPDTNYATFICSRATSAINNALLGVSQSTAPSVNSVRIFSQNAGATAPQDNPEMYVSIFR